MEVNNVTNAAAIRGNEQVSSARRQPRASEETVLRTAESLRHALDRQPAVRSEEVERGKALLANRQYPPPELINGLSKLLGERLNP